MAVKSEYGKLLGRELLGNLCETLDLDPAVVRRIVIDANVQDVALVYVEMIGDERLLNIKLEDAKIVLVNEMKEAQS